MDKRHAQNHQSQQGTSWGHFIGSQAWDDTCQSVQGTQGLKVSGRQSRRESRPGDWTYWGAAATLPAAFCRGEATFLTVPFLLSSPSLLSPPNPYHLPSPSFLSTYLHNRQNSETKCMELTPCPLSTMPTGPTAGSSGQFSADSWPGVMWAQWL